MWTSAIGSTIRWRGMRYWISPGGRILLLGYHYGPEAVQRETASVSETPANPDAEATLISVNDNLHAHDTAWRGAWTHSETDSGSRKAA
jgi:hypothetical protein